MNKMIEEYLGTPVSVFQQILEKTSIDFYYDRRISSYRSSTVIVESSWRNTKIIFGEESHFDEFDDKGSDHDRKL
ncbi:MAG: hypothetical protein KIH03_10430 [Paludibacteraceae bacterium]|nr:hypothetical protein [Paludibacteraceae bacterium]